MRLSPHTHVQLTYIIVARGFIPAGLLSSPEPSTAIFQSKSSQRGLRLLRSRTGINPLATGQYFNIMGCVSREGGVWRADPATARELHGYISAS
jgi:hypothetical protein